MKMSPSSNEHQPLRPEAGVVGDSCNSRSDAASAGVDIDVDLPYCIHRTNLAEMVGDIVKGILHQRNQIPVNYDKLMQQVKQQQSSNSFETNALGVRDVTNLINKQQWLKQKKQVLKENTRKRKTEERFCKKAVIFLDGCEQLLTSLKQIINADGNDISSVRLLLGATSVSTKVSYKIVFPDSYSEFPIENFRPGRYLFRSMVTNEHIVKINSEKLPPTNLFVFVEMRTASKAECSYRFLPALEPREPGRRTKNVTINIRSKPVGDQVRNGNLFTPSCPKIASRPYGQDIIHPASMELCTPITNGGRTNNNDTTANANGKRIRKYSDSWASTELKKGIRKRHFSVEICTPRGVDSVSMEMCTPSYGVSRGRGSIEMCTPSYGVSRGRGSMEFCTPLPSYRSLSLTSHHNGISRNGSSDHLMNENQSLTTAAYAVNSTAIPGLDPATTTDGSMDMCTPAAPLPRRSTTTSTCSSMDLCTPAPTPSSSARLRHSSMELCTPHVARQTFSSNSSRIFIECQQKLTDLSLTPPSTATSKSVLQSTTMLQSSPAVWLRWPVGIKGIPFK